MKKLFLLVSVFTAIAYQLAFARDYYGYEQVGRDDSDYIYINDTRYARVPEERVQRAQSRHFVRLDAEQSNEARRRVLNTGNWNVRPYVGIDGSFGQIKYKQELDKELLGKASKRVGAFAGLQFNQYVGLEAFYQIGNTKEKKVSPDVVSFLDVTLKDTLDFTAYGFDLMGYIPIQREMDIILGLGYGWYEFEGKIKGEAYNYINNQGYEVKFSDKVKDGAVRLSLGTQFLLDDDWAVRILGRYMYFSDDDAVKNMMELSLGLRYMF